MTYTDRVRFEDVDFARVPFYARHFTWVDRAWEFTLNDYGIFFSEMVGDRQIGLPIIEAVCRYRKPLALDDDIAVHIRVPELTRRAVTTEFRLMRPRDAALICEGHIKRRFVDMRIFRGMDLPDGLYELFEKMALAHDEWPEEARAGESQPPEKR